MAEPETPGEHGIGKRMSTRGRRGSLRVSATGPRLAGQSEIGLAPRSEMSAAGKRLTKEFLWEIYRAETSKKPRKRSGSQKLCVNLFFSHVLLSLVRITGDDLANTQIGKC